MQTSPGDQFQWTFIIHCPTTTPSEQDCSGSNVSVNEADVRIVPNFYGGPVYCATVPAQSTNTGTWPDFITKDIGQLPTVVAELLYKTANAVGYLDNLVGIIKTAITDNLCVNNQPVW